VQASEDSNEAQYSGHGNEASTGKSNFNLQQDGPWFTRCSLLLFFNRLISFISQLSIDIRT
jgi:hypothetical protein